MGAMPRRTMTPTSSERSTTPADNWTASDNRSPLAQQTTDFEVPVASQLTQPPFKAALRAKHVSLMMLVSLLAGRRWTEIRCSPAIERRSIAMKLKQQVTLQQ